MARSGRCVALSTCSGGSHGDAMMASPATLPTRNGNEDRSSAGIAISPNGKRFLFQSVYGLWRKRPRPCLITPASASCTFPPASGELTSYLLFFYVITTCERHMLHSRVAMLLAVLVVLVATTNPGGVSFAEDSTSGHYPPLLDCTPAPARSADNDSEFRSNVASALAALPFAVAAEPTGFATTRSGRDGRDRAFARGLCYDAGRGSSAGACHVCLSAAAEDVSRGCGGANSRRAGVWRAGCFLSYADTDASSAREDAFRGWFYVTAAAAAAPYWPCAGDRTPADCARCLEDSARVAAALGWLPRSRGEEVAVVGYGCCLRVQISVLPWGPGCQSQILAIF
ncbi:hypothetical protein ACP70R_021084 [Stipagrostis hirtigluma subsp. patula]